MSDHLMPRDWSSVVRRITRSITMLKNSADIKQPCLTPVLTSKLDLLFCNLHVKLSKKLWMTWTICCGIPCALRMCQRLSWWMLPKTFLKSTKLMFSCLGHSVHCSVMFLTLNIWSMRLFLLKNLLACFSVTNLLPPKFT